jgi:MFS family permease
MESRTGFILALGVVSTLLFMGRTIIIPTLPLYARLFDASDVMIGGLVAANGLARLLFDIPAGGLALRRHPKRYLILGLSIVSASSLLAALATDYWMLLIARMIEGAGASIYVVCALTLMGQATTLRKRGRILALYIAMIDAGTMIGPLFGGYTAEAFGLSTPFYLYAVVVGVAAIWTAFVLRIPSEIETSTERSEKHVTGREMITLIRNPAVMLVGLATLSLFLTRGAITQTAIPIFAFDNLGATRWNAGILLSAVNLASLLITAPSGALTDRVGRKPMAMLSILATATVILLIPFAPTVQTLLIFMVLYGLALGLSGPTSAWFIDVTPPDVRGTGMGLYRLGNDFGLFIGPAIAGLLIDVTKTPGGIVQPLVFQATAIFLFIVLLLISRAPDPVRSQRLAANRE